MSRFEHARYINLGTFRRDGRAVDTPVWFTELDGKLYAFSEARAGKIKRLRNSPRARVAVCDVRGRLRDDWTETAARVVDDASLIERVYTGLRRKYGWQMMLTNTLSRLSGRIKNRAVLEIDL